MASAPRPPSIRLLPSLPVSWLSSRLPVALKLPVPVSTRLSMLSASTQLMDERTVSVPSPAPSVVLSLRLSTTKVSLPKPPLIRSAPRPPSSRLFPALPVSTLSSSLPVALVLLLLLPVRTRFSMLAPSVKLTAERTRSLPSPVNSVTRSPALSTT